MSESLEEVKPLGVGEVTSDAKGEPAERRYSFKGIKSELKEVVWLTPGKLFAALGAVVAATLILSLTVHGLDQLFSGITLKIFENANASYPAVLTWVTGTGWLISLISSLVFALKHPSPGDTLASIFGGEIVAQGSGLSPREKRLEKMMAISVVSFLVFSFLFALTF